MKIKKDIAVAFLVALGLTKAVEYDGEKLLMRTKQIPSKVEQNEVPPGFEEVYKQLVAAAGDIELEFEALTQCPNGEIVSIPVISEAAAKKKLKASVFEKKPKRKIRKRRMVLDSFGSVEGSFSQRVNAVMSDEWKSEADIVNESKLPVKRVRGRLYHAVDIGVFEHRRLFQYRIAPKKENQETKETQCE
jgi:hypothetical protein